MSHVLFMLFFTLFCFALYCKSNVPLRDNKDLKVKGTKVTLPGKGRQTVSLWRRKPTGEKAHCVHTTASHTVSKSPMSRKTERPNEKLTLQHSWWELMLSSHRQNSIQRRGGNSQSRGQKAESLLGIRRDELVRGRQDWQQEISLQRNTGESCMNDKEQSGKKCLWGWSIYTGLIGGD